MSLSWPDKYEDKIESSVILTGSVIDESGPGFCTIDPLDTRFQFAKPVWSNSIYLKLWWIITERIKHMRHKGYCSSNQSNKAEAFVQINFWLFPFFFRVPIFPRLQQDLVLNKSLFSWNIFFTSFFLFLWIAGVNNVVTKPKLHDIWEMSIHVLK